MQWLRKSGKVSFFRAVSSVNVTAADVPSSKRTATLAAVRLTRKLAATSLDGNSSATEFCWYDNDYQTLVLGNLVLLWIQTAASLDGKLQNRGEK